MTLNSSTDGKRNTYIAQGEFSVSDREDAVIAAILGSCVSVCIWDPGQKIGGMNHILLPESLSGQDGDFRFGAVEMERLINAVVKRGGNRNRFVARVFGGASMLAGLSDIGARNISFAFDFLDREGIRTERGSVGGSQARRVRFWPHSGLAQQKLVAIDVAEKPVAKPKANDVELF